MENELCRWTSVQRDNLVGGSLWGLNGRPLTSVPLKSGSPLSALSLCSAWKSRASLKLGLLQKAGSHNIWPSWTFNQHLVKSLKKPSKAWSYAKRTSSIKQHRATSQTNRRISPRVTSRDNDAGFPTSGKRKTDQRHCNLKARYQTTFILLNWSNYL